MSIKHGGDWNLPSVWIAPSARIQSSSAKTPYSQPYRTHNVIKPGVQAGRLVLLKWASAFHDMHSAKIKLRDVEKRAQRTMALENVLNSLFACLSRIFDAQTACRAVEKMVYIFKKGIRPHDCDHWLSCLTCELVDYSYERQGETLQHDSDSDREGSNYCGGGFSFVTFASDQPTQDPVGHGFILGEVFDKEASAQGSNGPNSTHNNSGR